MKKLQEELEELKAELAAFKAEPDLEDVMFLGVYYNINQLTIELLENAIEDIENQIKNKYKINKAFQNKGISEEILLEILFEKLKEKWGCNAHYSKNPLLPFGSKVNMIDGYIEYLESKNSNDESEN